MIAVIDYGAGNIQSISNGLKKVGADIRVTDDPKVLGEADALVLPGVGAFGDAMQKLEGLKQPILDELASGKNILAICIGIQLLMDESMESPGVKGLNVYDGVCEKFSGDLKVPHMGWNNLEIVNDSPLLDSITGDDFFYFVHSYYVKPERDDIVAAKTEYGISFPSVISDKNIYATQFHPEKSSTKGLKILKNFLDIVKT